MKLKIKNALVSVFDKENIISLLKAFKKYNIKIISSGGTYDSIKKHGYECTELSKFTGFKEMLKHFILRYTQEFCMTDKTNPIKMKCLCKNSHQLI